MLTKCNKGECEYNHEGCCIDNFDSCAKNRKKLITEEEYDESVKKREKKKKSSEEIKMAER